MAQTKLYLIQPREKKMLTLEDLISIIQGREEILLSYFFISIQKVENWVKKKYFFAILNFKKSEFNIRRKSTGVDLILLLKKKKLFQACHWVEWLDSEYFHIYSPLLALSTSK